MIEEIDMGEMKLPNLLILPCFGEEGGGMKRNEAGGIKKAPDASRTEGFELFCISAPQGYGDFCLMGKSPSLIFIFCLQLHVCGLKPHRVRYGACSFLLR